MTRPLLLLALAAAVGCASPADDPPLEADLRFNGTRFAVVNRSPTAWHDCQLRLNDAFTGRTPAHIGPGETVTIAASELTDGDGRRFDVGAYKPRTVVLWCNDDPSRAAVATIP